MKDAPRNSSVLDIGSSSGILLNDLIDLGFEVNNLFGVDISPNAVQNCKENGIEHAYVMDAQNIELDKKFDYIIASDCLEHLEDDNKALQNWRTLLKPNGTIYVFVPAFMTLWSEHDVANMHYRRYTKKELTSKMALNGFNLQRSNYWNFFLFPPVLVVRLLGKLTSSKGKEATGDLNKISVFNIPLLSLINFENKLHKYFRFPFGVSTYCIAKKAD